VPDSRLLLKTSGTHDPTIRDRVLSMFTSHGIAADRIELLQRQRDVDQHLASYHRVDIALDTLPYHGTTTTCEAMYMGVPVVTCAGDIHASRVGVSLLSAVGLSDLIARDEAERGGVHRRVPAAGALVDGRVQLGRARRGSPALRALAAKSDVLDDARPQGRHVLGIDLGQPELAKAASRLLSRAGNMRSRENRI